MTLNITKKHKNKHTYIHTSFHIYALIRTYIHVHTLIHRYIHKYIYTHSYIDTYIYKHILLNINTYMQIFTHTSIQDKLEQARPIFVQLKEEKSSLTEQLNNHVTELNELKINYSKLIEDNRIANESLVQNKNMVRKFCAIFFFSFFLQQF